MDIRQRLRESMVYLHTVLGTRTRAIEPHRRSLTRFTFVPPIYPVQFTWCIWFSKPCTVTQVSVRRATEEFEMLATEAPSMLFEPVAACMQQPVWLREEGDIIACTVVGNVAKAAATFRTSSADARAHEAWKDWDAKDIERELDPWEARAHRLADIDARDGFGAELSMKPAPRYDRPMERRKIRIRPTFHYGREAKQITLQHGNRIIVQVDYCHDRFVDDVVKFFKTLTAPGTTDEVEVEEVFSP